MMINTRRVKKVLNVLALIGLAGCIALFIPPIRSAIIDLGGMAKMQILHRPTPFDAVKWNRWLMECAGAGAFLLGLVLLFCNTREGDTAMMKKKLYGTALALLAVVAAMNFWLFARFTVDDAFISWRYGKNLILHGIWNYNPSSFDMTRAYTSPLFAFLSIIPAFFHWDVVLFFKILSCICLAVFGFWYAKKTPHGILIVLIAYALPQTMIHAFSGLETFLFIAATTMLLVAIYENNYKKTLLFSVILLYTRPESLTLFLLIPLLYVNLKAISYKDLFRASNYTPAHVWGFMKSFITRKSVTVFCILLLAALPDMLISYINSGSIFPSSFFVKNSNFSLKKFGMYAVMLLPLLCLLKHLKVNQGSALFLFFAAMVFQYAKTEYVMDYALRSTYHILVPIGFFYFYVYTHSKVDVAVNVYLDDRVTEKLSFSYKRFTALLTVAVMVVCLLMRTSASELVHLSNYYYRALISHVESGKVIHAIKDTYGIKTIACGDAGMLAFQADIDSLDLLELGSASLIKKGIAAAYALYKPDVLFLFGDRDVLSDYYGMPEVLTVALADDPSLHYIGKVTWLIDYSLWVYSTVDLPEFTRVFEESYVANFKSDRQVLLDHVLYPPWSQWHE